MSPPSTYTMEEIEDLTGFERRTISYYVQQKLLPKVGRRGAKTRYPQLFVDRLLFIKMIRERQDRGEIGSLTLAEIGEILERAPAEIVADVVAGREPMDAVDIRVDPEFPTELKPTSPSPRGGDEPDDEPRNGEPVEAAPRPFQTPEPTSDVIEVDMSFADEKAAPAAPPAEATTAAAADDRPRLKGLSDSRSLREIRAINSKPPTPTEAGDDQQPAEDDTAADGDVGYPPVNELDRLGWSLARLQKVLTDTPRMKRGNTESWHRARITPELTISARNLTDVDAHMLDSVARILKKMLWTAWEE